MGGGTLSLSLIERERGGEERGRGEGEEGRKATSRYGWYTMALCGSDAHSIHTQSVSCEGH